MLRSFVLTILAFLTVHGANLSSAFDRLPTPIEVAVEKGNTAEVKRLLDIDPKPAKMTFGSKGHTLLQVAAYFGHKEIAELLLAKGADPNAQGVLGRTSLHIAARFGHLEIVKMLINKGASVSAGKDHGWTPLHVAVGAGGDVEVAAWLIEHGSPLDVKTARGQSLLHIAVQHGRAVAMVKLLAAKGVKVNQRDGEGRSPLHFSLDVETTAALLAAGADPNARDKWGNTLLYRAIVTRELAMVELLLDNGARANTLITPGRSALDVGAGFPDVAKLLVKRGAASTQPLYEACQRGDLAEATRLLEKYPAFVNSSPGGSAWTLLHRAADSGNKPIAELLISKGANVDAHLGGRWPLHVAAKSGKVDVAALLIAKGATIDVRDGSKRTPLHLAARCGAAELVELLLKDGAEVNAEATDGQTPLHDAVWGNQRISAKHLIDAGADLTARKETGWNGSTPLHLAVLFADRKMVELLLSAGAPVDAQNEGGETPLDVAIKRRRKDGVIELLRDAKEVPATDGQGESRD